MSQPSGQEPASAAEVVRISSRENPLLKDLRRLAQDGAAHRKLGRIWLEGEHLCRALLAHDQRPAQAVFSESMWAGGATQWAACAARNIVLPDPLFASLSGLESVAGVGFVLPLPAEPGIAPCMPSVILDRVQDAGNVGSILRSAAAFGFSQVIALRGSALLWGPKVLRAGMGAHFGLRLVEGVDPDALEGLALPIIVTSSHHGLLLHQVRLPTPCAWAFGHEGQGVAPALQARASLAVRIAQPGGEESLNVAAAAAVCLHASATLAG